MAHTVTDLADGDLAVERSDAAGRSGATILAGLLAAVATILAIVGLAVAIFFNPLWINFAQERAGVPEITGYAPGPLRDATGSILWDVIVGPPTFEAAVDGERVLGATERSHMTDVHGVVRAFALVVLGAVAVLALMLATRGRRPWLWGAISGGAAALALFGVAVGIAALFFFEAAFLLFHRIFFPQGNFLFDPRTQRLTQLFPQQLFIETSVGLAVVGLVIAVAVAVAARRRAARLSG